MEVDLSIVLDDMTLEDADVQPRASGQAAPAPLETAISTASSRSCATKRRGSPAATAETSS